MDERRHGLRPFARAVYDLRTAKGWSQQRLAEAAGIRQGAISRIEQAGTLPTLPVVLRIADALDAKVVIVVDRDNTEKAIEFTMTPHAAAAWACETLTVNHSSQQRTSRSNSPNADAIQDLDATDGDCVESCTHEHQALVRDTKDRAGGHLANTGRSWDRLLESLRG